MAIHRSRFDGLPMARKLAERLLLGGPFVKGGRIEIGSIRPHEGLGLGIDPHLVEQIEVAQRTVQFPRENGSKIDGLLGVVVEADTQRVWSNVFERPDSINRMTHNHPFQRLNRRWPPPCLQPLPIDSQLGLMQLGPRFHQPWLPPRQRSRDAVMPVRQTCE